MSRIYEGLGGGFTPNYPALLRGAALEPLPPGEGFPTYSQQPFPLVDKSPNPLAYLKSSPYPP